MKKVFFTLLFAMLLSNTQLFAQNTKSVIVEYQEKRTIDEQKLKNYPERVQQLMREKSKWKNAQLIHNIDGSYYMLTDATADETTTINATRKKTFKVGQNVFFNDFKGNISMKEIRMYNENVIIKDKLQKYDWKLTKETKTINDIVCKKATTTNEFGREVIAWYTDKFGITNGPRGYYGLPGLIIYLDDQKYTFKMTKVSFADKEVALLKPSKDGKFVTQQEYMNQYVNSKANETQKGNRRITRKSIKN